MEGARAIGWCLGVALHARPGAAEGPGRRGHPRASADGRLAGAVPLQLLLGSGCWRVCIEASLMARVPGKLAVSQVLSLNE